MLQNRVNPQGDIIKTAARGMWMGNRGLLHDEHQQIRRPFKLKAWITCVLEFKGRQRKVMSPNLYTELFFLDEVTSFAAGHRPCFECRRTDAVNFKACWLKGNPEYGFNEKTKIGEIDDIMHRERIDAQNQKVTYKANIRSLPDGAFVSVNDEPYLWHGAQLHKWTPFGYEKSSIEIPKEAQILTPRSVVNAFRAGYVPQVKL